MGNYGVGAAVLTFLASMIRWTVDGRGCHSPTSQLGWCFRIQTDSVWGRIRWDSMGVQLLISLLAPMTEPLYRTRMYWRTPE